MVTALGLGGCVDFVGIANGDESMSTGSPPPPSSSTTLTTTATTAGTDSSTSAPTDSTGTSTTGECPIGAEGCACSPFGNCNPPLNCFSDVCVDGPGTTTAVECGDETYERCLTADGTLDDCGAGQICLVDDAENPTVGVCSDSPCTSDADCPCTFGFPTSCDEVVPGGGKACVMRCGPETYCPNVSHCTFGICIYDKPESPTSGTGTSTSTSG
jgi:hypothetical protein